MDISCNKPLMHFPPLHSGLSEGHSSCLMHPKKVLHEIHKVLHKIHKLHKNHFRSMVIWVSRSTIQHMQLTGTDG